VSPRRCPSGIISTPGAATTAASWAWAIPPMWPCPAAW